MKTLNVFVVIALFVSLLGIQGSNCLAVEYPTKVIRLIVPYGPGATDLAARAIAATIHKYLKGQKIIVENMPGAGGQIGAQFLLKSKPDGYTLQMTPIASGVTVPALHVNLPIKYDSFTFVAITQYSPCMAVVNSDSPIKTFEDLLKALKENPGKLKYSTSGPGTEKVGANLILKGIGLGPKGAIEIPFQGGAAATAAMLGGHVDFMCQTTPNVIEHIRAGKVRPLVVATPNRLPYLPDVPTTEEVGFPEYNIKAWRGIWGPPNLPDYVINTWEQALQKLGKDEEWLKSLEKIRDVPYILNSKETKAFVDNEFKRYRALFTELGILVK